MGDRSCFGHEFSPYYDPDGNPITVEAWSVLFHDRTGHHLDERVGDWRVSTVYLGLDHGWGDGAPLIYETMIFANPRRWSWRKPWLYFKAFRYELINWWRYRKDEKLGPLLVHNHRSFRQRVDLHLHASDQYCRRYSSRADAWANHKVVVKALEYGFHPHELDEVIF